MVTLATTQWASTAVGQTVLTALGFLVTTGLVAIIRILVQQNKVLTSIKHEVLPNNGTSLKDSVNRIELEQAVQGERLNNHIQATLTREH